VNDLLSQDYPFRPLLMVYPADLRNYLVSSCALAIHGLVGWPWTTALESYLVRTPLSLSPIIVKPVAKDTAPTSTKLYSLRIHDTMPARFRFRQPLPRNESLGLRQMPTCKILAAQAPNLRLQVSGCGREIVDEVGGAIAFVTNRTIATQRLPSSIFDVGAYGIRPL
jgi:hypothetical protein